MDPELRQYLTEMEARLDARIDGLRQHMAGIVDAAAERMRDFTQQTVDDMETRTVGKFMDVAVAHESRLRAQETLTRTVSESVLERMALLESRVLRLEQHPPSQ